MLLIINMMLKSAFADLKEAWSSSFDLSFEYQSSEINPQFVNIVGPTEIMVITKFHVELDGVGGDLHVTMPYSMIEPLQEILDAGLQSDHIERDERWLQSIREEMVDRFGELPLEAQTLLEVAELRAFAKSHGVRELVVAGKYVRISPLSLAESKQLRLNRLFPGSLYKTQSSTVMVTIPRAAAWSPPAAGAKDIGDTSLLAFARQALTDLTSL